MKIALTLFAMLYWILISPVIFLFADAANGSNNQLTEYELKLDTRADTNNCKYLKVSLDGLESHMLFGKSNSVASKVTDGSKNVWEKNGEDKCIGALLTYKGNDKQLLMLVIMKKITINSDPIETKFFKFEGNEWKVTDEDGFFKTVKDNRPDTSSFNPEDIDVSNSNKGSVLLSANDCPIGFELSLFLPKENEKIANLSEGTSKILEGKTDEYPLYFLLAKKDDNKKFGFTVIRTNNGYDNKWFKFNNNKWEVTDFAALKTYIIKAVGFSLLRGKKN